jgi:two-component sensor histidine kinase
MRQPLKVAFGRLSTGTKMLLILSAALMPLGFIALLTSLDTARAARGQREAAAQMTTALYAAGIDSAIKAGLAAVHIPLISAQSADYLCTTLTRGKDTPNELMSPIALFDASGYRHCQSHGAPIAALVGPRRSQDIVRLDAARGTLVIKATRVDGTLAAETEIRLTDIPLKIRNSPDLPIVSLSLAQGRTVARITGHQAAPNADLLHIASPLGTGGLQVEAAYQPNPIRSRTILLVVLPLLMWIAAAFTGWFVVSRLLLLPLSQLQKGVDRFRAGNGPLTIPHLTTPAHEIQDLAESFAIAADRILTHEHELEEGLARQTKLTREDHHRVKNNLQVVSSLINLHARGATEEAVADAYAAIQRRVDALAVVHRNHYAELEENRGLSLRALVGELASNLRASAPPAASGMPIALDMVSAQVSQDVAVPVAFLITEIVELMMHCNPRGSILVSLHAAELANRAKLTIETMGLPHGAFDDYPMITRFDRVITGLARQLRAPLEQDRNAGRFEIEIGTLP